MRNFVDNPKPNRRGAILVAVMIVLAVATALLSLWIKDAVGEHRQLRRRAMQAQAAWLVEAGLERAVAQLASDQEYTGEEWTIAGEELGGRDDAVVSIHVEPKRNIVRVQADLAPDSERRVRESKEFVVSH